IAAQVAAASVRNSELLRKIDTLNEINSTANKLRHQAIALNSKLRLPNVVQSRSVSYSQLYGPPALRRADAMSVVTVETAVQQLIRVVILWDPGAGKSTLASKLVHDIGADKVASLAGLVPLLLVVRKHTESLRKDNQTLLHYLEATCRNPYNVSPSPGSLEYLLLNGKAVVVIDGIDELGDSRYRADFARMIEGFANLYPLARV